MKRLLMFRHSTKDGVRKDTIGPKGFALACAQGETFVGETINLVAHSPYPRTVQTALAFLAPLALIPFTEDVLEVSDFGEPEWVKEILVPANFREVAGKVGNFSAVLQLHPRELVEEWAARAYKGILDVWDNLEDGETAVAFGHSPMIELALWFLNGFGSLPDEYQKLRDMEGVELRLVGDNIGIIQKIPQPTVVS